MDVTVFLSRLGKVRKSGKRWMACCPAHADKSPSLMVSERPDGSIGLSCFAGCSTEDVVAAVGLTMADLFLDSPYEPGYRPPKREYLTHADALRCLADELGRAALLAIAITDKQPMTEDDLNRGLVAVGRITAALEFVEHGQ